MHSKAIQKKVTISTVSLLLFGAIGCAEQSTAYQSEFGGIASAGTKDTSNMSPDELHASIEQARLDGDLTAEQARKAHTQLDVKGHLTREQIMVINRDRLAKRDKYETNKENLDVMRDTLSTGTSVTSDANNILSNIKALFR